jgi:myo-inositol-1(or 4)-monophosphatase
MTSDRISSNTLLASAHLLADEARSVTLGHFRQPLAVDNKAGAGLFDPVTEADREAERVIRRRLATLHPEHAILGEEMGHQAGSAPYTWVIDPIDGTRAFITGMPLWGTLIGVTHEARAVAGMMDQPYMGERVWAGETGGTLWRGIDGATRAVRVSGCERLQDARLTSTSPDMFARGHEAEAFGRLKAGARLTRFGGDCYAYCLLAAGHVDVVVECGLKAYDIVALVPIIERAGGVVSTWDGGRPEEGGRIVAAASRRLHDEVLAVMTAAG